MTLFVCVFAAALLRLRRALAYARHLLLHFGYPLLLAPALCPLPSCVTASIKVFPAAVLLREALLVISPSEAPFAGVSEIRRVSDVPSLCAPRRLGCVLLGVIHSLSFASSGCRRALSPDGPFGAQAFLL